MQLFKYLIWIQLVVSSVVYGQHTDTITFYSEAFKEERTIYVQTPYFYHYQSDIAELPVIYLLDGQHDWFVKPIKASIEGLQETKEIPNALIVTIPHKNRIMECGIDSLNGMELPLHTFITNEVDEKIQIYHPNNFKLIIGHSFSASFALYSYLKKPEYYAAVISNSPLDRFEEMILAFEKQAVDASKISISVGGISAEKDMIHRTEYNRLKNKFPKFFSAISVFEADFSSHNGIPIVSTPLMLARLFEKFSERTMKIAQVNSEYKLIEQPKTVEEELAKIKKASILGTSFYQLEVAEFSAIASRYQYNEFNEHAIAVYNLALNYYPNDFLFHLELYNLYMPKTKDQAKIHLEKARDLLLNFESNYPEKQKDLDFINEEQRKNGW